MTFRIPKEWIYHFATRLLGEAGISDDDIEDDLESLIYEAGGRGWEESYDGDFYFVEFDDD